MGVVSRVVRTVAAVGVLLAVVGVSGRAMAADPPKWVAAIYVDAQRSVGLRWMPVPGATGYKVLRSETKGSGHAEIAAPTTPQHFDQAVEPGTTYYYVLQSVAADGASANSDEKSVTIPGQKKKAINPPTWRTIQDQQSTEFGKTTFKVGLQWSLVPDAVAYNIYRSEVSGKDYQMVSSISEDQFVDATVAEGKTYYYVLTALDNAFQETKYSEEKSVTLKKKEEKKDKAKAASPKLAVKGSKLALTVQSTADAAFTGSPDLVVDTEGNIYAPDVSNMVIQVWGLDGSFKRIIGEKGPEPGQMIFPMGIGIDSDNNIYVADRANQSRIVIYSSAGKFLRQIIVPGPEEKFMEQFTKKTLTPLVSDVAVGKDGRIYAVDNALARLLILDQQGNKLKEVGGPGQEGGKFLMPGWCAINAKGELHICNGFNRRVEVMDLEGNFIRFYGISTSFVGSFIGATGVTFDDQGNSVVTDSSMSTIQFFNPEGEYLYHMAEENLEIDKQSKQRSALGIANPVGITYYPPRKMFIFSQGTDTKTLQGRVMLP